MRGNTLVMLIIALVFGAISVFLANIWLKGQTNPATPQVSVAPATVETSTIVVAYRDLAFGEILQTEMLREIPWPKSSIPDGAFAKIADIIQDGNHVVLSSLSPNEPVLKWKISGAGARASLSAIVTPGMRAVTIRLNDVGGVAGFVLPGDRVDMLYTRGGNGTDSSSTTDVLLQNIRFLAVYQIADQKKSDPVNAKNATVEVTAFDSQKIALAQSTGTLSLTLRAAGSVDKAPAQRVVEQELVSSPSVYQTAIDAQNVAQALLDSRLKGLEGSINISKAALDAKLASLEDAVKQTSKATGQGEEALRKKLAALEIEIKNAGNSTDGEDALRAKLAEFEANLRDLAAASSRPVVLATVTDTVIVAKAPTTMTIGITRGTKRDAVQVPAEILN